MNKTFIKWTFIGVATAVVLYFGGKYGMEWYRKYKAEKDAAAKPTVTTTTPPVQRPVSTKSPHPTTTPGPSSTGNTNPAATGSSDFMR